jgi:hypothetical protein
MFRPVCITIPPMIRALTAQKIIVASFVAIMLACSALAQTAASPDLSGTWVLNLAKSKVGKHNTITTETIVIANKDSALEFRDTVDGKQSPPRTYTPDGKEHTVLLTAESQVFTKARWKKSALITESSARIVSGPASGFEPITLKSRWSLSADGRVLTEEIDDPRQTYVYHKQ